MYWKSILILSTLIAYSYIKPLNWEDICNLMIILYGFLYIITAPVRLVHMLF